ncbi:hypothetical protein N7456_003614 [Penicillium angulare]|uniref:Zn(2)-C6 fungal-type domain-containing protein n=1 Tax=Penicillium angulare TaxID=116970 RepID=A0A9W9FV36_9EURO|nr:hypothetical protein N7456_003614 [Penicillium angulare]
MVIPLVPASDASTMAAVNPPTAIHVCPHCEKQFDRRDLKERHRRRCEKTINKAPATKKRSCQSCITSKVKCDCARPSCSRCLSRQTKCEYKLDAPTNLQQRSTSRANSATANTPNPSPSISALASDHGQARLLVAESMAGDPMAGDNFDPQLWFAQDLAALTPDKTGLETLMSSAPFIHGLQLPPSPGTWGSRFSMGEEETIPLSMPTPVDQAPSIVSQQDLISPRSCHSGDGRVLNPLPIYRSLSQPSSSHGNILGNILTNTGKDLFDIQKGIQIISDYPARMLANNFQSPFIHPRLAHSSPKGIPEPIAVALACVGMKFQSQSPAKKFVCNVFRDQREKLIGELADGTQTLEELCSYLHALSIYQIEGLLSSNRYEAPFSSAELHHEYLIKMTRRLSRTHRAVLLGNIPDDQWETWTVAEAFRRTFYLVFLVHHLLGASKKLIPAYFEPLLDLAELRPLRLPCAEELWDAPNADEWALVRQHMDEQRFIPLSLGEVLDTVNIGGYPFDQVSRLGALGELQRLIISVVNSTCVAD